MSTTVLLDVNEYLGIRVLPEITIQIHPRRFRIADIIPLNGAFDLDA